MVDYVVDMAYSVDFLVEETLFLADRVVSSERVSSLYELLQV